MNRDLPGYRATRPPRYRATERPSDRASTLRNTSDHLPHVHSKKSGGD